MKEVNFIPDVFEEFFSPVSAAQGLLHVCVSKRKEMLQKTMGFVIQVLGTPSLDPRQKAGALHIVGAVADVILKKKIYKDQAELMLVNHVFPEFASEHGYLRARVRLSLISIFIFTLKGQNSTGNYSIKYKFHAAFII